MKIYSSIISYRSLVCQQHRNDGSNTVFRLFPAHHHQRQSLYSIASMYNVTTGDIVKMNPGSDQKLKPVKH